jgi:hypothetical protein
MTSINESSSIDEEATEKAPAPCNSMAYLTALNAVNLILLDTVTFQRNNAMLYTQGLGLAMKKIADGDEHGMQLLDAIQKSISFDQDYLIKSGKSCADILTEFKKLT